MRFQVEWSPGAEADLADLWLGASDRMAITRAQHRADQLLAMDPHQGRFHSEGLYSIREDPLKVYYEIDDQLRTVVVTYVYRV